MKLDRITTVCVTVLTVLLVGVTVPVFAHHSKSMYDLDKTITLECTVTEVDWGNLHTLFLADAMGLDSHNAPVTNWNLEGPSPNTLISKCFKKDTLKVGDRITVTGNPRKDGKPHLFLTTVTDALGKHYTILEAQ